MGTHPIFESDFDCLTEMKTEHNNEEEASPTSSPDEDWLEELCGMLHRSTRLDVRLSASANVMMLTGSDEGRLFIRQNKKLTEAVFAMLNDPNALVQKDAIHSIVNLSADDVFNHIALENYNILPTIIRCITVQGRPLQIKQLPFYQI